MVACMQSQTHDNVFSIAADDWESAQRAKDIILGLVEVPEIGKIYT
jgi:hypothetical protein